MRVLYNNGAHTKFLHINTPLADCIKLCGLTGIYIIYIYTRKYMMLFKHARACGRVRDILIGTK